VRVDEEGLSPCPAKVGEAGRGGGGGEERDGKKKCVEVTLANYYECMFRKAGIHDADSAINMWSEDRPADTLPLRLPQLDSRSC